MTTTIKSSESERRMTLDLSDGDAVITIFSGDVIAVDATAFLDAPRSELGVLIIDKAEPLATWEAELLQAGRSEELTAEKARALGGHYLALADYLEAHPPVDEQQVEALEALLNETSDGYAQSAPTIARRLIATGKVTVQS